MDILPQTRFPSITEFLDAKNLSFVLINLIIFLIVQALFFVYVVSQNVVDVALETSSYQTKFLQLSDQQRDSFCSSYDELRKDLLLDAESDKKNAEIENLRRIRKVLVPLLLGLYGVFFLLLVRMFFKRERYTNADLFIVAVIFLAFSSEIFYYFFVLRQTRFISINQIVAESQFPFTTYEYPNIYPEGKLYPKCSEN